MKRTDSANVDKPIGGVDVKPGKQSRIPLGTFDQQHPPKGFTIELSPDPEDDAIITEITRLESGSSTYELVLQLANYGSHAVYAEVWPIR